MSANVYIGKVMALLLNFQSKIIPFFILFKKIIRSLVSVIANIPPPPTELRANINTSFTIVDAIIRNNYEDG